MDKFTQIKNFIRGQFEGVLDDEWCDVEATTLVLLQDRFDISEYAANEFIQAFFNGKLQDKNMKEFAKVCWIAEDIQAERPDWSIEKCEKFLDFWENEIAERMIEEAKFAIETMIEIDERDEAHQLEMEEYYGDSGLV